MPIGEWQPQTSLTYVGAWAASSPEPPVGRTKEEARSAEARP
jgi:hypothetical protein